MNKLWISNAFPSLYTPNRNVQRHVDISIKRKSCEGLSTCEKIPESVFTYCSHYDSCIWSQFQKVTSLKTFQNNLFLLCILNFRHYLFFEWRVGQGSPKIHKLNLTFWNNVICNTQQMELVHQINLQDNYLYGSVFSAISENF